MDDRELYRQRIVYGTRRLEGDSCTWRATANGGAALYIPRMAEGRAAVGESVLFGSETRTVRELRYVPETGELLIRTGGVYYFQWSLLWQPEVPGMAALLSLESSDGQQALSGAAAGQILYGAAVLSFRAPVTLRLVNRSGGAIALRCVGGADGTCIGGALTVLRLH